MWWRSQYRAATRPRRRADEPAAVRSPLLQLARTVELRGCGDDRRPPRRSRLYGNRDESRIPPGHHGERARISVIPDDRHLWRAFAPLANHRAQGSVRGCAKRSGGNERLAIRARVLAPEHEG